MLEESRMDRKSMNRPPQTQSRAPAVDCKKNSDLTHNKPWPRQKKRDTVNVPKNEPCRKNFSSARGRGQVVRRPRAHGHGGPALGGAPSPGIGEDEPELGSVLAPGSKKQSLNHLLNFMYTPRGPVGQHVGPPTPVRRQTSYRKHNQDLYLQASCQFVVKKCGDYTLNLSDPDVLIDWNQIEEVVLRASEIAECPICLCAPVAGRVGRCGHPMCWACALHYSAVHDQSPPPCPVCLAPLPVTLLKPTRTLIWKQPAEEVCMVLVRRLRGSTIVEVAPPRGQVAGTIQPIQPMESITEAPFCKLFTASEQQVQNILERERKELQDQIFAEIDTTEIVYIEQALEILRTEGEKLKHLATITPVAEYLPNITEESVPIIYEKQTVHQNTIDWFDITEETSTQSEVDISSISVALEKCDLNPEAAEFEFKDVFDSQVEFPIVEPTKDKDDNDVLTDIDKENRAKYFYFYQAADGQQVFLHSINVRLLNSTWGSLSAAPALLKGTVRARETFALTQQQRKHMPCAAHLPLHCPIEVLEIDLKPPYVTKQVLKNFSEELDRRARTRARMQQKERRLEKAYQLSMAGPIKPDFSSETQFPPTSPSNYTSPAIPETSAGPIQNINEPSTSGIQPPSGLSFAKMASSVGSWQVRAPRSVSVPLSVPAAPESVPAPRALSLSDAIEAALHAPTPPKGRNKKSKKKQLLLTTGMQYSA